MNAVEPDCIGNLMNKFAIDDPVDYFLLYWCVVVVVDPEGGGDGCGGKVDILK